MIINKNRLPEMFMAILLLFFYFNTLSFGGYKLQLYLVILIVISFLGYLFSGLKKIKDEEFLHLRLYYYMVISLVIINLVFSFDTFLTKGLSMMLYLCLPLILIGANINEYKLLKKTALYILLIYLFSAIFMDFRSPAIDFYSFSVRTNLAWSVVFLYMLSFNQMGKYKFIIFIFVSVFLHLNSSRSPFLVFIFINFYLNFQWIFSVKGIYLKVIAAPVLLFFIFMNYEWLASVFTKLFTVFDLETRSSTSYRHSVLVDGWNYGKNYFFGQGYNSFYEKFDSISRLDLKTVVGEFTADNTYIEILFDAGFIPLVFFIIFIVSLIRSNEKDLKAVAGFIISLCFVDTVIYNNFWVPLLALLILLNSTKEDVYE